MTHRQPTDSISLLNRFIELWEACWVNPDEPHTYHEFYQYAKLIVATENNIQEDVAHFLLSELSNRWDFDNADLGEDEISPEWAQLHFDIAEYLPGI